jgi:cation diffusion facilitator CzcD-associated flavoprotein CzcO
MEEIDQMADRDFDVVVVGAGFAGMYLLHRLRGMGFSTKVFEMGSDVGGTWYWNRYPGARCDIESMQYSYQFDSDLQQDWEWTERYAPQPEILKYAQHVAERFDLRRDIQFDTRVTAAHFDDSSSDWDIATGDGKTTRCRFLVLALGCLSSFNMPKIDGIDDFQGNSYHTGQWPHEGVDFTGQRVAVIGTGSSAIQSIPIIAQQADDLTVFQRTPNYSIPAHNRPQDEEYVRHMKANYPEIRAEAKSIPTGVLWDYGNRKAVETPEEEIRQELEERWQRGGLAFLGGFTDTMFDERANAYAADFVKDKIREIVKDPETAELLSPKNIIGGKRLCVDTDYYATYNLPHVHLVDVSEQPVERIVANGVQQAGRVYEVDSIVYATGFDAMTGSYLRIDIRGADELELRDKWEAGPRTYLGLTVAGFPNMFMVTGPGSPSVLTNMIPSIEQHVEWITDAIAYLRDQGKERIEAVVPAEDAWVDHVNDVANKSLRAKVKSWYVGANIPGKPTVFMPYIGGLPAYIAKCEEVVANNYEGFKVA